MAEWDPSERHIEAFGLFHENNFWYVWGIAITEMINRNLERDRMLVLKELHFFSREHVSLDDHLTKEVIEKKFRLKYGWIKCRPVYHRSKKTLCFVSEENKESKVGWHLWSQIGTCFARWYLILGIMPEYWAWKFKLRISRILEIAISSFSN